VGKRQERGAPHGEAAKRERALRRQRRRGDEHRREEEHGEGILQAAGEVEEGGELQDVEAEEQGRRVVAEPVARRIADAQREVDERRGRDDGKAFPEREREAEAEMHPGDGGALARHREPAEA
jgi:hypothetical protein